MNRQRFRHAAPRDVAAPSAPALCAGFATVLVAACSGGNNSASQSSLPEAAQTTAVGAPSGAAVSATIGAAGGRLVSADGALTVEVPQGAFAQNQIVSIQPIGNEALGGVGPAYRITPEGLDTPQPMTLYFHYDDAELQGTAAVFLSAGFQDAAHHWHRYRSPQRDAAAHVVSVQTRHFSDWSLLAGVQLRPPAASVKVGESLPLQIMNCRVADPDEATDDDELLVPLIKRCEATPLESLSAGHWAVNGVDGGSAGFGTVVAGADKSIGEATYTAPGKLPSGNPVAVSVDVLDPADPTAATTIVSQVTVIDPKAACNGLGSVTAWDASFGLSYDYTGTNPPGTRMVSHQYAEVTSHLLRQSSSDGGASWVGRIDGVVSLDESTVTADTTPYTSTVKDVSGVPDNSASTPLEGSHVYLNVDLSQCRYNTGIVVYTQATQTDTPPGTGVDALRLLGSARSDWRPLGSTLPVAAERDFYAHSEDWAVDNDGDVYFPGGLAAGIFDDGYAAEGQAGTARVSWALTPGS
jgi:hypothetical protein